MREKIIATNIIPSHTLGEWLSYSTENLKFKSSPRFRHVCDVPPLRGSIAAHTRLHSE